MKIFIIITLMFVSLQASSLYKEIENIVGKNTYVANQKIIKILFKNQKSFYKGSRLDYVKVLSQLKENNLINYSMRRSGTIHMSFATTEKQPLVFMKLLKTTLNNLGYSTIDTQKVIRDRSGFLWKVTLYSDSAPDPLLFATELDKQGCFIVRVKRYSVANWRYNINISRSSLIPQKIALRQNVHLAKPLEPYWINVEHTRVAILKSSKANHWHPYVIFYDQNLNMMDNFSKDIKSYNVRLEVPKNAKYMKISDLYTLENIKRGLFIYLAN